MLISILLTLTSTTSATLPAHLGRANHAATLARLAEVDPALVTHLHEGDGPKPLTCSGLLNQAPGRNNVLIKPQQPYFLRITGLTRLVSQALAAVLLQTPPAVWSLHGHTFQVIAATCEAAQSPWSGQTTYEELAAAQLLQTEELARQVTLDFASPTSFKSAGINIPLPMPNLVFGSLVERWNAFSPITLSPEMRLFGTEAMAISRYRLESQAVEQKNKATRIGAIGQVTYAALMGDRYWLALMQMLADFALYSGVGVQTTTGMGQCRRVV